MIIHDDDDDLKVNLSGPFENFQRSKFNNVSKLTLSLTWEFEKQAGNLDLCQRSHPGAAATSIHNYKIVQVITLCFKI